MKVCDIVLPVWNELDASRKCIDSIKKHTRYPCRLIVVDNGSAEPTKRYLESLKDIFSDFLLIRNNTNLGFVKAVNQGIASSNAPYICILNNDTLVTESWLSLLIDCVESGPQNIGIANPTSNVFGRNFPDGKRFEWQELDSCKGFCMLIKRRVIEKIGLFDEIYGIGYFEERDFSRRAIEAGYICIRSKASYVYHKDKLSFGKRADRDEIFAKNEKIFNERWGRSLNIAFVNRNKNKLESKKDLISKLLDKGYRVHIFFPKRAAFPNLKDHIQIRYFPVQGGFFKYVTLFKIWERRKKKKIEVIVSENGDLCGFFKRFAFFHKADILDISKDSENSILSFCLTKSLQNTS